VFVAVDIQDVMSMRNIDICGLSGSEIFFDLISQTARLKKNKTGYKICVAIFFTTFI